MCDPQNPRSYWSTLWELLMVYCPTVAQMEAAMMMVAMEKSDGCQKDAAVILGYNRKTLNYKLREPRRRWESQLEAQEAEEQRQFQHLRERRRDRLKAVAEPPGTSIRRRTSA